jgi:HPr kinase/phosphorylase
MKNDRARETRKKSITVGFLYEQTHERFKLKQLNGENGFDNQIKDRNLNRPGLALAGYVELFTYDRVQLMGNTEIRYLN